MSKRKQYPEPVRTRSGGKVGWHYYTDRAQAEACSAAALHNARIQMQAGYDFGYCSPGGITETSDGLFEVCIP